MITYGQITVDRPNYSVVVQEEVLNYIKERRSNGSLHRVFACSAGGPVFDSRLRPISLGCSMPSPYSAVVPW
jgi:hypothetical protein